MNITRRSALRGGTAVAASAALIGLAEATPSPDTQLVAWEAEIHQRNAAFDQGPPHTDPEVDAFCELIAELDHRIAETEAHTVRGLEVMFRRLVTDIKDGEGAWTKDNLRTMLASSSSAVIWSMKPWLSATSIKDESGASSMTACTIVRWAP